MTLEWSRMKAVVLESDDWGLCAWSADEQALRVLSDLPVFRSREAYRYAGSTLESAADVRRMADTLLQFKGGDGFAPVLQANTVMAAPDYVRLRPPAFDCAALPLVDYPQAPPRWMRTGLWGEVVAARDSGVWWPELHGLHHLPETSWLRALRQGADDARRAFDQQSPVCEAVTSSSEYDPSEPLELRRRNLEGAARRFRALFGRDATSWCPPDYRSDRPIEAEAEKLGITIVQGRAERGRGALPRVRHFLGRFRFPHFEGKRFLLPPRIAFEPGASTLDEPRLGVDAAHRNILAAWAREQPAIVSTHRANYVQIDPARGAHGLMKLRELLTRLAEDGATFVTDAEVRSLVRHGWSSRAIGNRGVLVRHRGARGRTVRLPKPSGVEQLALGQGRAHEAEARIEGDEIVLHGGAGAVMIEWRRA